MQAVILAGGKGTRLRPLTIHTPKPIVPVVNRPFLLYQIDLLRQPAIKNVVLCLSYQPRKIEELLSDGSNLGMRINYLVEASPLGTAGAFKNAEAQIEGTTVVFNGDILTDVDLSKVIDQHHSTGAAATIVVTPLENPAGYGVVESAEDGRVTRFVEKPQREEVHSNLINAGIYVLEPSVLKHIPQGRSFSFEYDFFPTLLNAGESFYAYRHDGYWLDIGTPEGYLQGNLDVLNGRLRSYTPERPIAGEKFDLAARIDERSYIDSSCVVKAQAQIVNSIIGPNCFIEEKARIENSVIWSATRISAESFVRYCVIGKSGHIGRSAVLIGAVLGDKSVVTDYSQLEKER
jgi:NDP-sugar pyrophosphorylase family protein